MGRSGTGLGMAVVWGTVKDHNGYIDLQSAEGKGTTFTLYFPVSKEALMDDQAEGATVENNGNGEKILVVDDIEEQRRIATLMLKKLGYDVNSVPGGEEAIEFLQDHSADLIVLDMIMEPGIDGLETYKQILQINPDQKAIIASGFSESWRVKEAQRLGVGAYVKKPYTIEKIGQAVTAELSK
jgi:CheY-like chemotaxis protein